MSEKNPLEGRKVYIPQMNYATPRVFAGVLRSIGIDADVLPDSDHRTNELAGKYLSGEECYPAVVTLGNTIKAVESGLPPDKIALFMPTAEGPCRFGQYADFMRKTLKELGLGDVYVLSPSSADSYQGLGEHSDELVKSGWLAVVSSDILEKLRLKIRPYELNKGETNTVFEECVEVLEQALENRNDQMDHVLEALKHARERFRKVPVREEDRPLIGIVGEIFCRLNGYSNAEIIEKIEENGGEAWQSDITEWVWYTLSEQKLWQDIRRERGTLDKIKVKIRETMQHRYEHEMVDLFEEDFRGREEPNVEEVLANSERYLPQHGAHGEMVLNIGKVIYFHDKGADGVVDISPFTCMNGIVTEAIYPRVSREYDDIPINIFYFDGTQTDLDRDIGIFMELARNYRRKKNQRS